MSKSMAETFRGYGINVKEVLQREEYPPFNFSIFKGMDEKYDKIRSDYRRIKNSSDYSPEFKEKKREEALAAIDALKAEYYTDAMLWIDKTYRWKQKPKIEKPTYSSDRILWELERNKELTVLDKQLQIEPAEKLLELYHQYKDTNEEAVTLLELELRKRKDQHGTNESVHAARAWTEIQLDQHAGDLVAEHYETQLRSVLYVGSSWYSRGLENGFDKAQYGPIEL